MSDACSPVARRLRSTISGITMRAGRTALDLLLPPQCLTCDQPVDRQGQFCPACFRLTGFVTDPLCARCGVPFGHAAEGGLDGVCPSCRDRPPPWGRARAALRYDAQSRRIVLPFKHGDRTELATALAALMARAGAALLRETEVLVPVPLHRRRLLARRYNQAALLAWRLARIANLPSVPDVLIRARATTALGELSAEARRQAVEGAFAVRPHRVGRVAGKRVLLIDDVMTSGATCAGCSEALLEAGAAAVDVLVAARVPDPRL
jgi:ComF family protein